MMSGSIVAMRNPQAVVEARPAEPVSAGGALSLPAPGGEPAPLREPVLERRPSAASKRRSLLPVLSFIFIVVVPTTLAALYYLLVASDQYVAEFRFALRSSEPTRVEGVMSISANGMQLPSTLESYAIAQYIGSRAIVDDLGKKLDLRRMFSPPVADWPARLPLPATAERLVDYWQHQVDAFFDPTNGTIIVRARAFTPADALTLAQAVLACSERLVNDLSARARRDAVRNGENDVAAAERRLSVALARLRDYRDKQGLIDPHKAADANAALAERLRDELVRAGTELSTLKQYLRDDAPALKVLAARIDTLKAQRKAVESEATVTVTTRDRALSRLMGSYEELESERRFAETSYQHALEALDRTRIEADRQQVYVADFVPPSLPEEALYPRRWRSLGIVLLAGFLVWAIGSLTLRSVRDHI